MTDEIIYTFTLFLVTIDPIGLGPIFLGLTGTGDNAYRREMAIKGTLIATGILLAFAIAGDFLLTALGVGLPAFRIAGGILLFLQAIDMAFARPSGLRNMTSSEDDEAFVRDDISVFPLAIPLIAGPGAITSVLLAMGRYDGDYAGQGMVLGVMLAVLALTFASFLFASRMRKILGLTGTNVIGRVLGIILAALACQFVLDGLSQSGLFGSN